MNKVSLSIIISESLCYSQELCVCCNNPYVSEVKRFENALFNYLCSVCMWFMCFSVFFMNSLQSEGLSEVKRQTDRVPHKSPAQTYLWLCCDNIFSRQTLCWSCETRVNVQMMVLLVSSLSSGLVIFITIDKLQSIPTDFQHFFLAFFIDRYLSKI